MSGSRKEIRGFRGLVFRVVQILVLLVMDTAVASNDDQFGMAAGLGQFGKLVAHDQSAQREQTNLARLV